MTNTNNNLKMSLLDNGVHSLKRGYEIWNTARKENDGWLLKESIIWVHHGIELLLKQLLVQTNEFLVFQDVNKAVERLGILRKNPRLKNAGVLELFDHDEKVTSIGFMSLIERVSITLAINELDSGAELRKRLDNLTKFRNKIVHFSVVIDIDAVSSLLGEILDPLLELLSREINDTNFKKTTISEIRRSARSLQEHLESIRCNIAEKAVSATIKAMSSNLKAGIVSQPSGTGLTYTLASYLEKIQDSKLFNDKKIFIITDNEMIKEQLTHIFSHELHSSKISKHFKYHLDIEALSANLNILTIEQIIEINEPFHEHCLVVRFSSRYKTHNLEKLFPTATRILFSHIPKRADNEFYGDAIATWSIHDAINDKILVPFIAG
jgi:hypothetical protein